MADNKIANAIKFLKGEEKSLPATKTEGQVYFAYKNVGTAEKPSYTGAIYIDTPIGGTQNRIKMTANADIADKAFNDSTGLSIRDTYLSSLGYTDDGKQTILIKGSGNNQTRIALPIASTTKSGIVTTDAQSFNGTKTFTTINSTNLTVTGSNGFNYSSISAGTADVARPVWFADNSGNGKPVVNTNFTYNPATQTLKVANLSGTADKATKDSAGNDIRNTYISNITINGTTLTFTKGGGATSSITLQDTNNAVTQTAIKSNDYTNWHTVLWGASNSATEGFAPTTVTDCAFTSDTLIFQPSSGTLKAKIFKGSLSGNASTATSATKATYDSSGTKDIRSYVSDVTISGRTITVTKGSGAKVTLTTQDTDTWRGIQNNLTSDSTTDSLSAAQGKYLKSLIDGKSNNGHNHDDRYYTAAQINSKLANYLSLTGGTLTGALNFANGTWNVVGDDVAIGDMNIAGTLGVMGKNGNTSIKLVQYGASTTSGETTPGVAWTCTGNGTSTISGTLSGAFSGNLSGNATTATNVAWSGVTGKPSTFTPSSHEHDYFPKSGVSVPNDNLNTCYTAGIYGYGPTSTGAPNSTYGHILVTVSSGNTHNNQNNWINQLAFATDGYIYHREKVNDGGWRDWEKIINTSSLRSYAAPKSHTHIKSQITDFPSSLPASDVYSWAKASSKPSYTKSEVGLGNVDNTADSQKLVKYATSAGSASSASSATTAGTCTGNSATATSVVDYGNTSAKINIGYAGSGISGDAIKYLAGYTTGTNGASMNIKNISKDALKAWLGLGSLAYSSATIPTIPSSLPANGGNASTVNGHTVNTDVPANAKFTDTWRPLGTTGDTACAGNDSRLSNARPASDVYGWAKASTKPTYSWGEITGKPGTFTPSSHTHYSLSTIGDQRATATTPDSYSNTFVFQGLKDNGTIGITSTDTYSYVLGLRGWADPSGGDSHELAFNSTLGILTRSGGTTWNAWRRILDSANYIDYTVTKDGLGAYGTWGISISGSSESCTGNADTATKLQTSRTINGTMFDGSSNITTTNWGTGRYISIRDCDSSNTGTPALVDGSSNTSLYMPSSARFRGTVGIGSNSGATLKFYSDATTISAKIVAYNDRIEFVFG